MDECPCPDGAGPGRFRGPPSADGLESPARSPNRRGSCLPAQPGSPSIQVRDLRKTYVVPEREGGVRAATTSLFRRRTKSVEAVAGISFDVEPGEIVGFLGP